jgi:SAM-dependent methyltransferase
MKIIQRLRRVARAGIESVFRPLENGALSRGSHLKMIPAAPDRRGGTRTYIEWGYTIGFFQPLIFQCLPVQRPYRILDVGSGVGRLAIACAPYLGPGDRYIGLDVNPKDVAFSQKHYDSRFSFVHLDAHNATYAPSQQRACVPWPVETESFDLITALSVWTHMREEDARFYLKQAARALKPKGRALITFFVLDDLYRQTLAGRRDRTSQFYPQPETKWIFDKAITPSRDWFAPSWATEPEEATAINEPAFHDMIEQAGLCVSSFYPGAWKEHPGLFFQDVSVLEKRTSQLS